MSDNKDSIGPRNAPPQAPAGPDLAARARKTYKSPSLVRWGTLSELTEANGGQGRKDGGRKPYRKTR